MLTDHLVPLRLWTAATLASGGTLTSSTIDGRRFKRLESLTFQLAVAAGNPDIKIERQDSEDGVIFSSVVTVDASTATTFSGSPSGLNVDPLDAPLTPFFRFKLTDLATKITTVTMTLEARE